MITPYQAHKFGEVNNNCICGCSKTDIRGETKWFQQNEELLLKKAWRTRKRKYGKGGRLIAPFHSLKKYKIRRSEIMARRTKKSRSLAAKKGWRNRKRKGTKRRRR